MNLNTIESVLPKLKSHSNASVRMVVGVLSQNGVNKDSINKISGTDWYEFAQAAQRVLETE